MKKKLPYWPAKCPETLTIKEHWQPMHFGGCFISSLVLSNPLWQSSFLSCYSPNSLWKGGISHLTQSPLVFQTPTLSLALVCIGCVYLGELEDECLYSALFTHKCVSTTLHQGGWMHIVTVAAWMWAQCPMDGQVMKAEDSEVSLGTQKLHCCFSLLLKSCLSFQCRLK